MKKESEPAILQRFLNVESSAGGNTEVAARRSKWIASGTEVLRFLRYARFYGAGAASWCFLVSHSRDRQGTAYHGFVHPELLPWRVQEAHGGFRCATAQSACVTAIRRGFSSVMG